MMKQRTSSYFQQVHEHTYCLVCYQQLIVGTTSSVLWEGFGGLWSFYDVLLNVC